MELCTRSWTKFVEEDSFGHGCLPDTASHSSGNDVFASKTLSGLVELIANFVELSEPKDIVESVVLGACGEPNRIDVAVMETGSGRRARSNDIAAWKRGKKKLYYAIYSFYVERVEEVDLVELRDEERLRGEEKFALRVD